jgi:hypothetical protein
MTMIYGGVKANPGASLEELFALRDPFLCRHQGVGLLGCRTCDPDESRVRRAYEWRIREIEKTSAIALKAARAALETPWAFQDLVVITRSKHDAAMAAITKVIPAPPRDSPPPERQEVSEVLAALGQLPTAAGLSEGITAAADLVRIRDIVGTLGRVLESNQDLRDYRQVHVEIGTLRALWAAAAPKGTNP